MRNLRHLRQSRQKSLNPSAPRRCVDRGARDRWPSRLDCPGVVPLVGENVATGVAEHVRVRLQFEARNSSSRPLVIRATSLGGHAPVSGPGRQKAKRYGSEQRAPWAATARGTRRHQI
jgi:hypothetical protein